MRKPTLLLITLMLAISGSPAWAQYSWFIDFKTSGYSGATDISIAPDDQLYAIVNFKDGVIMNNIPYAGEGSFLVKLSKTGQLQWHKILRFPEGEVWNTSQLATDGQGNVYLAIATSDKVVYDNVTLINNAFANSAVVTKLNPEGVVLWTKVFSGVQEIYDMKVNSAGSVLLHGGSEGVVKVDHITIDVKWNSFTSLISPEGVVRWARRFGDLDRVTTFPKACALDDSDNAYVYGLFRDTLSLDTKRVASIGGSHDLFFTKLNPQGVCQWLVDADRKLPPGGTNIPIGDWVVERGAIEVDNQGNVYAGGTFWRSMTIGGTTLTNSFPNVYSTPLFLLKLDGSSGTMQWVKAPTSTESNSIDDIIVKNNRVYFAGLHQSSLYFSAYTPSGEPIGNETPVPLLSDVASGLAVDSRDSVYMSGRKISSTSPYVLEGFVFRYNYTSYPPPTQIASIEEPTALCSQENKVVIRSSAVAGALSYEWEIVYNNQSTLLTSAIPEIEIVLSDIPIEGNFSVRIRGVNDFGKGPYSQTHAIVLENPLESPNLEKSCTEVYVKETGPHLKWFEREQQLEYPEQQVSISPSGEGFFHVTISNSCGSVASNPVEFKPIHVKELFIPNIITPNHDADNEYFIVDENLGAVELTVYNRWGNQVFHSPAYLNRWSGGDLPVGVYFYTLKSPCITRSIQGSLTIRK